MSTIAKQIKAEIVGKLPPDTQVTSVELEGPEIAVYTKNPAAFFNGENYVAKIAFDLKKRINVRTDKSLLTDEAKAKKRIEEIVPPEAGITDIQFAAAFSEVMIESMKPGLVIGKGGVTSKQIILETGWVPNIVRAPTIKSDVLRGIRNHLVKYSSERKKMLKETAEKIYREMPDSNSWVRLTALGAFRQVGRSCVLVETKETKVILDCGVNVASLDEPYPYLDAIRFPIEELDAVIIGHAHLDHSGFAPYLFKVGYRGPVYCTPPTRDLMTLLQFDFVDVLVKEGKEPPYTERDVKELLKYTIARDYREVTDIAPDMRLTFHNAAHILGSAACHLHIGNGAHNLVYTGDLKFGFTRLFNNADTKFPRVETMVIESTYGGRHNQHLDRYVAEERLIQVIKETIEQGGNVLIPVFAVGRAQEIMLVIEDAYRRGVLPGAKAYIDGMTNQASAIHTAYPEYLRKTVQRRILQNDSPFTSEMFQTTEKIDRESVANEEKAIILASSGMLTGGPSVQYLHLLAENPKNTLIFVGWQGEGSPGRKIQGGLKTMPVTTSQGKTKELKIRMRVETAEGFSGHSDRQELNAYIRNLKVKPRRVLVNHGEKSNTLDFAKFLGTRFGVLSSAPQNLDSVRLR